jgi:hypothetical protein
MQIYQQHLQCNHHKGAFPIFASFLKKQNSESLNF